MMNPLFNRDTLSLEELEFCSEFKKLNQQQQTFVLHWIASGDQFFAFAQAYSAPDVETSRRGSYAVMQRRAIRTVIDLFLKKTPRELFLDEVDRILRSRKLNPSKLRALEMKAQILFGVDLKSLRKEFKAEALEKSGEKLRPIYKVSDLVKCHDGKLHRVDVINSDGTLEVSDEPVEGDTREI